MLASVSTRWFEYRYVGFNIDMVDRVSITAGLLVSESISVSAALDWNCFGYKIKIGEFCFLLLF
jgi:hypothetical protein